MELLDKMGRKWNIYSANALSQSHHSTMEVEWPKVGESQEEAVRKSKQSGQLYSEKKENDRDASKNINIQTFMDAQTDPKWALKGWF